MSPYGEEAVDLAKFDGALVINMGTLSRESIPNYLQAIKSYNERGNPVVYDPVGAAATHIRRGAVKELMSGGYFDLIKGNEGEIKQVSGSRNAVQRGVDSGPSTLDGQEKARLARDLARRERTLHRPCKWDRVANSVRKRRPFDRRRRLSKRRRACDRCREWS